MTEYIPPTYCKLGTKVKDLFEKKYCFANSVSTKHKSAAGVTLESTAKRCEKGEFNGTTKVTYTDKSWGEANVEVQSKSADATSAEVTMTKLSKGLEVVANGKVNGDFGLKAKYKQDFFSVDGGVTSNKDGLGLRAAGVIGTDGLNVGGVLCANSEGAITDWNVGCEYDQPDFTATLLTKSEGQEVVASYFQKLNNDTSVGTQFQHNPDKNTRSLKFGVEHQLDANTVFKGKASSCGTVDTVVEHRLANPNVLLGVSASFNALGSTPLVANKVGVALKFGDF